MGDVEGLNLIDEEKKFLPVMFLARLFVGKAGENSRGERPPQETDAGVAVPETPARVQTK